MLVHFWINYSSSHAREVQSFLVLGNREQGTGNREQVTGDREQVTGDREQGTLNREEGTGNREQGTMNPSRNFVGFRVLYYCINLANKQIVDI
ncbi:hypothetical protein PN451_06895 [Dolichospermum planctonicum CS-1226]|uniref:Uncharacterized protein n=1 Tax=Dolichospermum planctonicum CS-1226 TaxID=3021751 RepID=A0ABT5AFP5_9CYAN|nr:hypothetical protein [Dolichospermum planctonicum CS-1226]